MLNKVLTRGGVAAFVIYYLATPPTGAANIVTGIRD